MTSAAGAESTWFEANFARVPVMAILRGMGVERSLALATLAWDLGIESVEVPLQTDEDDVALRAVVQAGDARGRAVGAGTILTQGQITAALRAGAQYLVSPGIDPVLVRAARKQGVPILPGVVTPTDIQLGMSLGLTWLKAFPARWLGAEWFYHMQGPFPSIRFVATGGIHAGNVLEFLAAGASVVAVGSALEDAQQAHNLQRLVHEASQVR